MRRVGNFFRGQARHSSGLYKVLSALGSVVFVVGCSINPNHSGFQDGFAVAAPTSKGYSGNRPAITIDQPENKTVIVYSHGTTNSQLAENCGAFWNDVPTSLIALQRPGRLIYFLCTNVVESTARSRAGEYVYLRLDEVEATLDELIGVGVKPRSLFLAGHSAGGWVSLMASSKFPQKFNATIAFAPAFAGRRSNEKRFPYWRQEIRPRQIKDMLSATEINALVFAYEGDPFNRPEDLSFLTDRYPNSVELIGYGCAIGNKHLVHLHDCREAATTDAMARFIDARLREASDR